MSMQEIEDAYPLTSIQQGMLFHCLQSSQSDVYVTYISIDITGSVDPYRLEESWQSVVQRHGSLRASFQWEGLDEPLAVIRRTIDFPWAFHDWSELTGAEANERLVRLQKNERQQPISPSAKSLQRFNLVKLSGVSWKLLWSVHHLVADGWSTPVVLDEVTRCYDNGGNAPADLKKPFNFSRYVAWLEGCDLDAAKNHWSTYLGQVETTPINTPGLQVTQHNPEGVDGFQQIEHTLSIALTDQLNRYCRDAGITLSTVMHGLWAIILQQYTGKSRVVFCTTSSGRQCGLDAVDTAVGLFLNSLPVAVEPESNDNLRDWFKDLQKQIQQCIAFDYTPLSTTLGYLSDESEKTIESIVVMEGRSNGWKAESSDVSIVLPNIECATRSSFPLSVLVYPGDSLSIIPVFDKMRFSEPLVASLASHLAGLIEIMCAGRIDSVGELETRWRTSVFAEQARPFHGDVMATGLNATGLNATVDSWLDAICQSNSRKVAVIDSKQSITFEDLYNKSNQIAHMLMDLCNSDARYIGVYCERSIDQIVAFYGVIKAGMAYIPLDPSYPDERTRMICDDSSTALVLCGDSVQPPDYIASAMISGAASYSSTPQPLLSGSELSAVYLMYTSGSTGQARGVVVTHENLVHSTRARLSQYKLAGDRFILLSSCSFDSSVAGIYGTLCSGGTLVLPEQGQEKDVEAIAETIAKHQVTHTLCLPGLYRLLLQSDANRQLASLKTVIVAGESCPTELVSLHSAVLPTTALYNEYGPTEGTVWASVCRLDTLDIETLHTVPIGAPIENTTMFAVDERGLPCMTGVEGQLAICGPGISQGYHGDPERTDMSFVDLRQALVELNIEADTEHSRCYLTGDMGYLDFDGLFRFTGRLDRQVKVRGFRIEPTEIEAAMLASGAVTGDILVTLRKTVVADRALTTDELQALVSKQLESLSRQAADELIDIARSSKCIIVERD